MGTTETEHTTVTDGQTKKQTLRHTPRYAYYVSRVKNQHYRQ